MNNLIKSQDYDNASRNFRQYWNEVQQNEDLAKKEVVYMILALEKVGFSRMQALDKIIEDHKDLKGFSQKTIYRQLPKEMKNENKGRPSNSTNKNTSESLGSPNLSNDKLGHTNNNNYNYEPNQQQQQESNIPDYVKDLNSNKYDDFDDEDYEQEEENNVGDALDYVNHDIEDRDTEKDSIDHNQDITQIQQSNPIPNNYMLPSYEHESRFEKLDRVTDLPSEKINHLIEYHLGVIVDNYRQLWIEINRMIRKLYKENPNWKLSRIIYAIYESHDGTENYIPFNPTEIKKHLDTENKELFGIFKKDKPIQDMKSIEDMR